MLRLFLPVLPLDVLECLIQLIGGDFFYPSASAR